MDSMDFNLDEEDYLSTAIGTESLAARDMVPEGFDNTSERMEYQNSLFRVEST
jgi:hypothetical protein